MSDTSPLQTATPNVDSLIAFVRKHPGCTLETLDEARPFKVQVNEKGLAFLPNGGDGVRRDVPLSKVQGVLELMRGLASSESRQPSSYKDASHNASYILSLVQAWEDDAAHAFVSLEGRTRPDHLSSMQKDELWEAVRRAVSQRAKAREFNARIKHGFEVEQASSISKHKWIASVYWSDNLPRNDVEIAFNLRRLSQPEGEHHLMSAWFEQTAASLSSQPARNHSSSEHGSFRAGFTYASALAFFTSLGKQLSPLTRNRWALVPREVDALPVPIRAEISAEIELRRAEEEASEVGAFDPNDRTDARQKLMASIVRRRGQPQFREALLRAYDRRCAISGCDVVHALEAAHITPYLGDRSNVVSNGLLLRGDLHTLYDLGLLWVDPSTMEVQLQSTLKTGSYAALQGRALRLPVMVADRPDPEALRAHTREMASEGNVGMRPVMPT